MVSQNGHIYPLDIPTLQYHELTLPQVHADASNFASGVSKEEAYGHVLLQAGGLFYEQRNWVSRPSQPLISVE